MDDPERQRRSPAWMAALDSATPIRATRLALLLSAAKPKIVMLAAGAGLVMGSAGEDPATLVVWVLVFSLIASVSVAAPMVLYVIRGESVLARLARVRDWLQRNNSAVMAVVFLLIGLALIAKGASSL